MTKKEFVSIAPSLPVVINGTTLEALPRINSTGSVGYNVNGKVLVKLPNGQLVKLQVSGNLTVVGSKDGEEGQQAA
jgi:hypothetical protein